MNLKQINIIDPIYSKNNLGKSISRANSQRIIHSISNFNLQLTFTYDRTRTLFEEDPYKAQSFLA